MKATRNPKVLAVVLAIIVVVLIGLAVYLSGEREPVGKAVVCEDSDGGFNPNIKGETKGIVEAGKGGPLEPGGYFTFSDFCIEGTNLLVEYFCDPSTGTVNAKIVACPYGCEDGACLPGLPSPTPEEDSDKDGLPDAFEELIGTNPYSSDTDGDGLSDKHEHDEGLDPTSPDTDSDGVPDGEDNCPLKPNPYQEDTDDDGRGDSCEEEVGVVDKTAGQI